MSFKTRKKRQPLETAAFRIGLAVLPFLPRCAILGLARISGCLGYLFDRQGRRIGLANLDIAFGKSKNPAQKRRILRQAYRTMAQTFLDVFWFGTRPEKRLARYIDLDESLRRLLCEKRQIFVTAHFGNWEVAGQMMAIRGFPLNSIAMPLKNPSIDRILIRRREVTGQKIIPREGALRKLIGLLRADQKIAFVADQNTDENEGGIWVNFFGLPVPVTAAPAALSAKTGSDILMGFCAPQRRGHYRIYITEQIPAPEHSDPETIKSLSQQIQNATEEEIRKSPQWWLWMYKRWKRIGPGADPEKKYPFYAG